MIFSIFFGFFTLSAQADSFCENPHAFVCSDQFQAKQEAGILHQKVKAIRDESFGEIKKIHAILARTTLEAEKNRLWEKANPGLLIERKLIELSRKDPQSLLQKNKDKFIQLIAALPGLSPATRALFSLSVDAVQSKNLREVTEENGEDFLMCQYGLGIWASMNLETRKLHFCPGQLLLKEMSGSGLMGHELGHVFSGEEFSGAERALLNCSNHHLGTEGVRDEETIARFFEAELLAFEARSMSDLHARRQFFKNETRAYCLDQYFYELEPPLNVLARRRIDGARADSAHLRIMLRNKNLRDAMGCPALQDGQKSCDLRGEGN